MSSDPPDYLSKHYGTTSSDSYSYNNNPLLMPLDGGHVQQILFNFQDTTSYLSNDNSKSFVGKVYGMCTMKEHNQKVQMNTANDLERDSHRNVNPKLTLKSFQRSDAFRTFKPEDVRPSIWCRRTVYYALCYFADSDIVKKPYLMDKNFTFLDIYNFLRDRLRSIWQDLTVQRCTRHRGYIECFEISIRFLIYSNEVLCESEEYDVAQNILLLNTCLDKLMDGYSDVRSTVDKVTPSESLNLRIQNDPNFTLIMNVLTFVSPHEAEFWSYRLLLLIPQILTPGCSATFCDIIQRMPNHIKNSQIVKFSISACLAASSGNIYSYFKLMNSDECHPLQAALMNRFSGCIRVRFMHTILVNKIVNDGTNPFTFDTFKTLMGYEHEPDEKFASFLTRYDVTPSRLDTYISLDCANVDKLIKDNNSLAKIAGKTQKTCYTVVQKFASFKHRQLIFDPDFIAPNLSHDSHTFGISTQQPSTSHPLNNTHNIFNAPIPSSSPNVTNKLVIAESNPSLIRSDTFGYPSDSVFVPAVNANQNLTQPPIQQKQHFKRNVLETHQTRAHEIGATPKFLKINEMRRVKIYRPKLNEDASHLYFNDDSLTNLKRLRDISRLLSEKIFSNQNNFEEIPFQISSEPVPESTQLEKEISYGFDKFEYDKISSNFIKEQHRNYLYLNLNASFCYLENELNRFLNKKASKYILYSLYICSKCRKSKKRTKRLFFRLISRIKSTKTRLSSIFNKISEFIKSKPVQNVRFKNIDQDKIKENLLDMYNIISSKNFKYDSIQTFFQNEVYSQFLNRTNAVTDGNQLSPFNSLLSITFNNMESIIKNSKLLNLNHKSLDFNDPEVWGSGIFVHISFFDFHTKNSNNFGLDNIGDGLLNFKDHVRDYMASEYCTNLKLDILMMSGFTVDKNDIMPDAETSVRTMFNLMSCEIPCRIGGKRMKQVPFCLNFSFELNGEECLSRIEYDHYFSLRTTDKKSLEADQSADDTTVLDEEQTGDKNVKTDKPTLKRSINTTGSETYKNSAYTKINKSVFVNSELSDSIVSHNDPRYQNQAQIVVFACSRTLKLGDEDLLFKSNSNDKPVSFDFKDKIPVIDSLALLSYLLHNKQANFNSSMGSSCLFCYRLSVSKMDILALFTSCVQSETKCNCKRRCFKKIKSILSVVNRSLAKSLFENANAFNVPDAQNIINRSVTFTCVGFELEINTRMGSGFNNIKNDNEVLNVEVSRLLYPEGFKTAIEGAYISQIKSGKLRILQSPVDLPDMHKFLVDLMLYNDITLVEVQNNPQGILSHILQKFIVTVIVNFPERLWDLYSTNYKGDNLFKRIKRGKTNEEAGNELTKEYNKKSFVAMLMNLKEHIKETNHRIEVERSSGSHISNEKKSKRKEDEMLRYELSKFIHKVLECFRIRKFLVPYAVSQYLKNLKDFK